MIATCYVTDLQLNIGFFAYTQFNDLKELDNYIALMEENDFRVDRIVDNNNVILYDILE